MVEAISNANANAARFADCATGSGADTIELGDGSAYEISQVNNTFFGFTGLPVITSEITIDGNGATISRSGAAPPLRLLAVDSAGKLTLRDTILGDGLAPEETGATTPGPTMAAAVAAGPVSAARSTTAACSR